MFERGQTRFRASKEDYLDASVLHQRIIALEKHKSDQKQR